MNTTPGDFFSLCLMYAVFLILVHMNSWTINSNMYCCNFAFLCYFLLFCSIFTQYKKTHFCWEHIKKNKKKKTKGALKTAHVMQYCINFNIHSFCVCAFFGGKFGTNIIFLFGNEFKVFFLFGRNIQGIKNSHYLLMLLLLALMIFNCWVVKKHSE